MTTQEQQQENEDPTGGMCSACGERPPLDGDDKCGPCSAQAQDAAEARAGEEDARTQQEARQREANEQRQKQTTAPKNGNAQPAKGKPAPAPASKPAPAATGAAPAAGTPRITRGPQGQPLIVFMYGVEGIGKTTWALDADAPIMIPTEDGSLEFDCERLDRPATYAELKAHLRWLTNGNHKYKTAVLDTADAAEALVFGQVIAEYNASPHKSGDAANIEEVGGGYGKGYNVAIDKWRELFAGFQKLRARGMTVIILGHAHVKSFKNPEGPDFDRHQPKMNEKAAAFLREQSDVVLFANYRVAVRKAKGSRTFKGEGGRERVLFTTRTAAYDAKNRCGLPGALPMPIEGPYGPFKRAVELWRSPKLMLKEIRELLPQLEGVMVPVPGVGDKPIAELVEQQLAGDPKAPKLAAIRNRLQARLEAYEEEQAANEQAAAARAANDGGAL